MKGSNINLSFGLQTIFDNASFQINDKDKVGVVGVNGAGKTTLFKLLLKVLELDSGKIITGNARIGYLPQEIIFENENITVWDYMYEGRPIKKLEKNLQKIYEDLKTASESKCPPLLNRMAKIQAQLENYDYYNAEDILLNLVIDMQIPEDLLTMRLKDLSGGQKSKIAFARLLFSKADILLLDEPTNHLDVTTKEYVTNYLKNYHGTVLIISHDIDFLNQIINKILYINKVTHKILVYEGNYNDYKKKNAEEKRIRELEIERQEKEFKKLVDFVKKAKQASASNHALKKMGLEREKRMLKMKEELKTREGVYKKINISTKPLRESSKIPLDVTSLTFGYPEKPLLYQNLSFSINKNERFLVVGENGVGKSTLLKLLIGILSPLEGDIHYGIKTDIAYYAQELEDLSPEKTILENVTNSSYSTSELRTILGNFLFHGNDVFKKVEVLSPGEKARVALCKVLLKKANLLLLDEPTNHLDPETQMIIGENFRDYEGTIIVVSHNPNFVEQIGIDRMLILPYGKIMNYSPELLEYFYDLNTPENEKY